MWNEVAEVPAAGDEGPHGRTLRQRVEQEVVEALVNRHALLERPDRRSLLKPELRAVVRVTHLVPDEATGIDGEAKSQSEAVCKLDIDRRTFGALGGQGYQRDKKRTSIR